MNKTFPSSKSFPSKKEWEYACWRIIIKSLDMFEKLFTANERRNFVFRAVAIDRIKSGKHYREISEELWLSQQTISSIKKAMQKNSYQSYRERGKTERKKKLYRSTHVQPRTTHYGRPVKTKYGTVYLP